MSFSLFATCIDGQHKHLIAESFGDTTDEGRVIDGRGVDADLIRTATKQGIDVFRVRTPPPTVSGIKICSAVRLTTSTMVCLWELDAVTSRNVSSSAPWR